MIARRTPRSAAQRRGTIALAAAVCAATALAVLPSPVALRTFVAFPVLVLVAGHHGTMLVLGRPVGTARADGGTGLDGLLRTVLPVLVGMLALMAVVLLLGVSGTPIATPGVAAGTGLVALALMAVARRRFPVPGSGSPARSVGAVARRAVGPSVALLVLSAAVAGAVALRPVPVERYTQLALTEPDAVAGRPLKAVTGTPVTLRWTLRGYGSSLPAAGPAVAVTVGLTPAAGLRADVGRVEPGRAPGVVAERRGTVTFTAPAVAGHYKVRVTVGADPPLPLVVGLRVTT